jgi:hypothetical protein
MGIEPTLAAWEATSTYLIPLGQYVASRWFPAVATCQYQQWCRFRFDCQQLPTR